MKNASVTPVAVIGMGCRLPGGIESPEQFWQALLRGEDFITEVPPARWDLTEYYDPESGVPGKSPSKWGPSWKTSVDSMRISSASTSARQSRSTPNTVYYLKHLGKQSNTLGSIRGYWPARRPVCSSG